MSHRGPASFELKPGTATNTSAVPPRPLFDSPIRVGDLCHRVGDALIGFLLTDATPGSDEPGYGWRHEVDEQSGPPSAVATAYGMRAVARSGSLDRRVSLPRVRDTLRRLELPSGGWTAQTLDPTARPEITATVVGGDGGSNVQSA